MVTTKKHKAKKVQDKPDPLFTAGPPTNGTSMTGCIKTNSNPEDWIYLKGAGWYHKSEEGYIKDNYRYCAVSTLWGLSGSFVRTIYSGTKQYVHPSVIEDKRGWGMCRATGRYCERKDLVEARTGEGSAIFVSATIAGDPNRYVRCSWTNDLYPREYVYVYKRPHTAGRTTCSRHYASRSPNFRQCPECSKYVEKAGLLSDELAGGIYCPDCMHKRKMAEVIHKHDHKGYPPVQRAETQHWVMKRGKPVREVDESVRLFGVECEVEIHDNSTMDRYELAMSIQNTLGKDFVVMKNDGSLRNHPRDHPLWGFEIVTAPADIAAHRAKWAQLEKAEGFKFLRAWDTKTCGLHIHVSKAYMTTLQIGRIMHFVTHKKNRRFIEKVAGRNSEAASKFVDKGLDGALKPDPNKYHAVNIIPKHTIEFRIFRGTIRHQHIVRNLEFVEAVCAFCHPASRSFKDMADYNKFLAYCAENRKLYPFLTKWLAAQEYIPAAKVNPNAAPDEVVEKDTVTNEVAEKWY